MDVLIERKRTFQNKTKAANTSWPAFFTPEMTTTAAISQTGGKKQKQQIAINCDDCDVIAENRPRRRKVIKGLPIPNTTRARATWHTRKGKQRRKKQKLKTPTKRSRNDFLLLLRTTYWADGVDAGVRGASRLAILLRKAEPCSEKRKIRNTVERAREGEQRNRRLVLRRAARSERSLTENE